jgi:hypothetical protein
MMERVDASFRGGSASNILQRRRSIMRNRLLNEVLKVAVPLIIILFLIIVLFVPTSTASAADPTKHTRNVSRIQGVITGFAQNFVTISPVDGSSPVTLTIGAYTSDTLATGQTVTVVYNNQTMVTERMVAVNAGGVSSGGYGPTTIIVGTIATISENSVTISPSNGGPQVSLILGAHTNTDLHGLDSLAIGQTIAAIYDSQTMVADIATVTAPVSTQGDFETIMAVSGTIAAISENSVTITPSDGSPQVTLTLNDEDTNIDMNGLDSLAVGQTIATVYDSQTMVADSAKVNPVGSTPPNCKATTSVIGIISAICDNSVTLNPSDGKSQVTLILSANTHTDLLGINSLSIGQAVNATYNNCTMVANRVTVDINQMPQ